MMIRALWTPLPYWVVFLSVLAINLTAGLLCGFYNAITCVQYFYLFDIGSIEEVSDGSVIVFSIASAVIHCGIILGANLYGTLQGTTSFVTPGKEPSN